MLIGVFGTGRNGSSLIGRLLDGLGDTYVHPVEEKFLTAFSDLSRHGRVSNWQKKLNWSYKGWDMSNSIKQLVWELACRIPYTKQYKARQWTTNEYMAFAHQNMRSIFLSIARFAHINRPIEGYYFEFGSHEGRTMRLAWEHFQHLFDWSFIAFDSFEGLPEIENIDKQQIWQKGRLKTAKDEFENIVHSAGMPKERLRTIKGFYDQSLTTQLQNELLPNKAAVVYVDCDLYKSTVPVLKFIKPFLQVGTVIVFDDWNCFYGDPRRGERLAWAEFTEANPSLIFEPFVGTNEAQSFICIEPYSEGGSVTGGEIDE